MAFVKPSTVTSQSGAYAYKKSVSSTSVNYIDNSFPNILDKTGDNITGTVNINSGASLVIKSGGALTGNTGSTVTFNGVNNTTINGLTLSSGSASTLGTSATMTILGSETFNNGSSLTLNSGSTTLFKGTTTVNGSTLTVDGTSVLSVANGGIVSGSTGSTCNLATVNVADFQKLRGNVKSISSNYTIDNGVGNDFILMCDPTGGAFTITVPASSAANAGRIVIIKNATSSTNNVAITRSGSDTIDGVITVGTGVAYFSVMLLCSGTNWYSIGGVGPAA